MDIVLVRWKIRPEKEDEFLEYWKKSIDVKPKGLIDENLSKVESDETSNWDISDGAPVVYVNVGRWESKEDWKRAFTELPTSPMDFESELRERVWVSAKESH